MSAAAASSRAAAGVSGLAAAFVLLLAAAVDFGELDDPLLFPAVSTAPECEIMLWRPGGAYNTAVGAADVSGLLLVLCVLSCVLSTPVHAQPPRTNRALVRCAAEP